MQANKTLDCFGLLCPVPIIKMKKEIDKMQAGEVLEVLATDPGIEPDTQNWCKMTGHEYLGVEKKGEEIKVYVKKIK
ncbi:MAG: sulfurtransferase TusA family protein [Candidatus Margulisbacteria bacterium]|nr:sulfurtransferase TusA family protein [Candidatus Margulisiibacteriota bacterium]